MPSLIHFFLWPIAVPANLRLKQWRMFLFLFRSFLPIYSMHGAENRQHSANARKPDSLIKSLFKNRLSDSKENQYHSVLTVLSLLLVAGYNNTAYYPSYTDLQSSLTLATVSFSKNALPHPFLSL